MQPRRLALGLFAAIAVHVGLASAEVLTLPSNQWPEWVHRDGIVMAGSWEALPFRIRRDGVNRYDPSPDQQAAWDREHSPEMVERLKALGVNFVMMHCYKGAGLTTEKQSMADAVAFARVCHEAQVKVGVYNYSGAFLWEPFFMEVPQAREWILLDEAGKPRLYGPHRYYWNRNHPDAVRFYQPLVRFAIEDIQADLIHLDNYHESVGFDAWSIQQFRRYLGETFTPEELQKAGIDVATVMPPRKKDPPSLHLFAWRDFECASLAKSYLDMSRYARSLRKDILMECNPMSVPRCTWPPVDHGRVLPGGEACWDESLASGWNDGKLTTRIRTYKVSRLMDNMAFSYITSPIEAAESMAFNHPDCFGCICWFEFADIVAKPGSQQPPSPLLEPFIRFFHTRRDLLRGANVVADIAILRSFPSQAFAEVRHRELTAAMEDQLIARRLAFQIIYNQQILDLRRWPMLVLAGCVSLSDAQVEAVNAYVRNGGKLCIVGEAATHDQWMRPRPRVAFTDLPAKSVVRVAKPDDVAAALETLSANTLALHVDGPASVCAELTSRPDRRLVHLVNYDPRKAAENVRISVRIPADRRVAGVRVASPAQEADAEVSFETKGDTANFTLPQFSVYAVAIITLQ